MRNPTAHAKPVFRWGRRRIRHDGGGGTARRRKARVAVPRRGLVVVELALIMPFVLVLLFGICEIGQALRVGAILAEAARNGCASGSRPEGGNADVLYEAQAALSAAGLPGDGVAVTILVNDRPGNVARARPKDKITVTVAIPTDRVRLAGIKLFLPDGWIQSETTTMLKQG